MSMLSFKYQYIFSHIKKSAINGIVFNIIVAHYTRNLKPVMKNPMKTQ